MQELGALVIKVLHAFNEAPTTALTMDTEKKFWYTTLKSFDTYVAKAMGYEKSISIIIIFV